MWGLPWESQHPVPLVGTGTAACMGPRHQAQGVSVEPLVVAHEQVLVLAWLQETFCGDVGISVVVRGPWPESFKYTQCSLVPGLAFCISHLWERRSGSGPQRATKVQVSSPRSQAQTQRAATLSRVRLGLTVSYYSNAGSGSGRALCNSGYYRDPAPCGGNSSLSTLQLWVISPGPRLLLNPYSSDLAAGLSANDKMAQRSAMVSCGCCNEWCTLGVLSHGAEDRGPDSRRWQRLWGGPGPLPPWASGVTTVLHVPGLVDLSLLCLPLSPEGFSLHPVIL